MIGAHKLQLHMSVLDLRLGFPIHAPFQETRRCGRLMIGPHKLQLHMQIMIVVAVQDTPFTPVRRFESLL